VNPADAIGHLARLHTDQLVVTAVGTATQEWHRVFGDDDAAFHMHTMGLSTSFGLGLALALPDANVWAFEGDGGLLMNLGTLATIAHQSPRNLTCFIVANELYRTISGPALPNAKRTDLAALISAFGLHCKAIRSTDQLESFVTSPEFGVDLTFAVLHVSEMSTGKPLARHEGPEIKYRFARLIEQRFGRSSLGQLGY
jgi:thiamine pyrophosphate-dependent acetolactate synthase large subunit-like protein